jgi:hypothetical protein
MTRDTTQTADELATLLPGKKTLPIAGEVIEVGPLTMAQIARLAKSIRTIAQSAPDLTDVASLILTYPDEIIEAVAIAINKPAEWVGALLPDDFFKLAQLVVEQNRTFFLERVAPLVSDVMATMAEAGKAGPTRLAS